MSSDYFYAAQLTGQRGEEFDKDEPFEVAVALIAAMLETEG